MAKLGAAALATHLFHLIDLLGVKTSLAAIGMTASDLPFAIELIRKNSFYKPRLVDDSDLSAILVAAFNGDRMKSYCTSNPRRDARA